MSGRLAAWIIGIVFYLALVARITPYDLAVAAAASGVAALIFGGRLVEKPGKPLSPRRIAYAAAYALYYLFVIEPRCHLRVTGMILGLRRPRPTLIRMRHRYTTVYGVAALANSITNTPGTLTVDADEEELLVHCLEPPGSPEEVSSGFDRWLRRIFE